MSTFEEDFSLVENYFLNLAQIDKDALLDPENDRFYDVLKRISTTSFDRSSFNYEEMIVFMSSFSSHLRRKKNECYSSNQLHLCETDNGTAIVYQRKYPWLSVFSPKYLHHDLRAFLFHKEDGKQTKSTDSFHDLIEKEEILSFPCFTSEICQIIIDELDNFELFAKESGHTISRPNSMNRQGFILSFLGLDGLMESLREYVVLPLAQAFYEKSSLTEVDSAYGFIVEYEISEQQQEKDLSLGFHVDDSEVTLNVCLGREFEGGDLFFRGRRCPLHINEALTNNNEDLACHHEIGNALLHFGKTRHGALPICSGKRSNLILWCRSSRYRENQDPSECPWWCPLHSTVE